MRDMHFPWPARAEAKIDQSAPGMSRGTWLDSAAPCFRQATVVVDAVENVLVDAKGATTDGSYSTDIVSTTNVPPSLEHVWSAGPTVY